MTSKRLIFNSCHVKKIALNENMRSTKIGLSSRHAVGPQCPDAVVRVGIDTDELSVTKATYGEIHTRIKVQTGQNVTLLYIVQVKRKHGILSRERYNKAKADNPKMLLCLPNKEAAIEEALRFFGMIARMRFSICWQKQAQFT